MYQQIRDRRNEIRNEQMNMIAESLEPNIDLKESPEEFDDEAWLEAELDALEERRELLG